MHVVYLHTACTLFIWMSFILHACRSNTACNTVDKVVNGKKPSTQQQYPCIKRDEKN